MLDSSCLQVFQEARREENLEWFVQVLADVVMVYGLTASIGMSASLVVLMGTDFTVTMMTHALHPRIMAEYRKLIDSGRLKGRENQKPSYYVMIVIIVICVVILCAFVIYGLYLIHFVPAGTYFRNAYQVVPPS
ncbi:hypothetical protein MTO96_034504 [Rhipicephalus appendiculatus]